MKVQEGEFIMYAECESTDDMMLLANVRYEQGWRFLTKPFPSRYELIDTGEETTVGQPTVWTLVMHRFPAPVSESADSAT